MEFRYEGKQLEGEKRIELTVETRGREHAPLLVDAHLGQAELERLDDEGAEKGADQDTAATEEARASDDPRGSSPVLPAAGSLRTCGPPTARGTPGVGYDGHWA